MSSRPGTTTVVVMGVSGSGKSTVAEGLAARTGWVFAEGDDLHPEANKAKMAAGVALDDEDRRPWLRRIAGWIGEQEAAGRDAVVTCSALKRSYRDLLRDGHPSVRFAHVTAPQEVLEERMRSRSGHFMPVSLLPSQFAALEPLAADEPGLELDARRDPDEIVDRLATALGDPAARADDLTPAGE